MLSTFEKKVANFIKANDLFGSVGKVLLAVSGGADSTALIYAMCALKAKNVISAELLCAHINHQLRGTEARLDEDFVIAQTAKLRLAVTTKRLDVRAFARRNKLSIETAARKLRIENLLDIAKANSCNCIATAHQKNDNTETVLQRLLRGTGFRGLGGIWPVRVFADKIKFVRPLLCVGRDEIVEYLEQRNLRWRQDHTNVDCTYTRNYIRHRLLPALQQDCTSSIVEQLSELAQSARKFHSLVCGSADKAWPELANCVGEKVTLDLRVFVTQPQPVKVELIRRSLTAIGSGERNLTQRHYEGILQLAEQNVGGRRIELPGRFVVWREYGNLIFTRLEESSCSDEQITNSVKLNVPGRTRFGRHLIKATIFEADETGFEEFKAGKTNCVEWFDLKKVTQPLSVHFRRGGERFWPLGLAGEKKVGKFLTAAKVKHAIRPKVLIVADSEKIIWVWPIRISEQARITGETQRVLRLEITCAPT